jgi:hypothetical protein
MDSLGLGLGFHDALGFGLGEAEGLGSGIGVMIGVVGNGVGTGCI